MPATYCGLHYHAVFSTKIATQRFGVTVSPSHIEKVKRYILNQEEHHRHQSFEEEYLEMLKLGGD